MSNTPSQSTPRQAYYYQPPPTNALGIAGFVVSLSGLVVTFGLICPIGLLLSLIGLGKSPRGYAIAGSIVGVLGSILGTLTVLVIAGVIETGLFASNYYYGSSQTSYTIDYASDEIDLYFRENGDTLPDEPTGNALITSYQDEWNYNLFYEISTGASADYTITSMGPDGVLHTADDIVQFYTAQTATEFAFEEASWYIDDYYSDYGRLPNVTKGTSLISSELDSWSNALRYSLVPNSSDEYTLTSAGADGQFDNADDITRTFTGYASFGGPALPDTPEQVDQDVIDAAFNLAAQQIVESFPAGTSLPTEIEFDLVVDELLDPWLTPMRYSPTNNPPIYHLKSAGPDKQWDTDDDLTQSFYFSPNSESEEPQ